MKNSQFEDLLRKKALDFKPPVLASVLSGIKAATSISYASSAKSLISNMIYSLTFKSVITIAVLSSVIYFTINKTYKETDYKNLASSRIVQNKLITNPLLSSENNKITSKIDMCTNSVKQSNLNVVNESYSEQNFHKKESISDSEANNFDYSDVLNHDLISSSNKICGFPLVPVISISKLCSPDSLNQQGLLFEDSISLSSFNNYHILSSQDMSVKNGRSPLKIFISSGMQIGKSFLLNDKTNSNNHEEKHSGSMLGGDLALFYGFNKHWRLCLKGSYQKFNIESKFYSNNVQDGIINRKLTLLVFKAGIQYMLFDGKKWSGHITAHAGLANKLKHQNHFSGKYFSESFSLDLKNEDKWSPATDLSFTINYNFTENLSVNIGVFSDLIQFNKNSKIFSLGGQIGITYNL
jgi:hypothetical protein